MRCEGPASSPASGDGGASVAWSFPISSSHDPPGNLRQGRSSTGDSWCDSRGLAAGRTDGIQVRCGQRPTPAFRFRCRGQSLRRGPHPLAPVWRARRGGGPGTVFSAVRLQLRVGAGHSPRWRPFGRLSGSACRPHTTDSACHDSRHGDRIVRYHIRTGVVCVTGQAEVGDAERENVATLGRVETRAQDRRAVEPRRR